MVVSEEFLAAVAVGDANRIQVMLAVGLLNANDVVNEEHVLTHAFKAHQYAVMQALVNAGGVYPENFTSLFDEFIKARDLTVKLNAMKQANLKFVNDFGKDLLAEAIFLKRIVSLRTLLRFGALRGGARHWASHSPVMLAVSNNFMKGLEALLTAGADVNALSWTGLSGVTVAVRDGNVVALSRLLSAGADPNAGGWGSLSNVAFAASRGREDVVRLLVAGGGR